jgi:hypothetical protein
MNMNEKNSLANLFDQILSTLPTEENRKKESHIKSAGESLDRMIDKLRVNPASYYETPYDFSYDFRLELMLAAVDELSDRTYKRFGLSGPGDFALLENGPHYRYYRHRLICAKSAVEGGDDPLGLIRSYGDSPKLNVCIDDLDKSISQLMPQGSGVTNGLMQKGIRPARMPIDFDVWDMRNELREVSSIENDSERKKELLKIIDKAIVMANSACEGVQAVVSKRKKFSADRQAEIFSFQVTYS